MQFKRSENKFNHIGTWGVAIENMVCPRPEMLDRFDQSGYDLCELEQEYAKCNLGEPQFMRYKSVSSKIGICLVVIQQVLTLIIQTYMKEKDITDMH